METGHRAITVAYASQILADLGIARTAAHVKALSYGPASAVFLVRSDAGESMVLKMFGRNRAWKAAKEAYVYGRFRGADAMPVPQVLAVSTSGSLEGAFAGYGRLAMSVVPGMTLAGARPELSARATADAFRSLGAIVRRSHENRPSSGYGYITTAVAAPLDSADTYAVAWLRTALRRFQRVGGDSTRADEVRMFVRRRRDAVSACERPVLCHNDLNEGNVFVAELGGLWAVTGIVDVEDAISGDPMIDLARIHHLAAGQDDRRWLAFLSGYGVLPSEWADRVAVYRLLHAIDLWSHYRKLGWRTLLPAIERDIDDRCHCPIGEWQGREA